MLHCYRELRREEIQEPDPGRQWRVRQRGNAARDACREGGTYAYGSYPDLDELFQRQAAELDKQHRETILHKMQQIVHERTMYAPIWQLAFINGHGPRVGESGFGLIPGFAYTGPYEDITIKS
jgi:ABC-type transport system substrate-binding protein